MTLKYTINQINLNLKGASFTITGTTIMTINEINEKYENIEFSIYKKIGGDYQLRLNDMLVIDDSACEDYYGEEEDVLDIFSNFIDSSLPDGYLPVIDRAIAIGFDLTMHDLKPNFPDWQKMFDECEEYILLNAIDYRFEQCDLYTRGYSQSYCFNGTVSGDIFDFSTEGLECAELYRVEMDTMVPVKWYDIPDEGEERSEYVFVFATEVDYETGDLVKLYDFFK